MNPKVCLALCVIACALGSASPIFGSSVGVLAALTPNSEALALTGLLGTGGGAATAVGSTVFLTASGATVLGGIALLKGLAVASVLSNRAKRQAVAIDETDLAFSAIAASEPAQCYRRLICELATGANPKSDNDIILSLFNKKTSPQSPKFPFAAAAALGKQLKNVQSCEIRYSCPLSGAQIQKLIN